MQSIQNTAVDGTSKRPNDTACDNSTANYGNQGTVSVNTENTVSKCDASSTSCKTVTATASGASARDQQPEMLVLCVVVVSKTVFFNRGSVEPKGSASGIQEFHEAAGAQ